MISSVSLLDRDSSDPPFLQPDDARSKRLAVLLFEVARSLDHDLATALPRLEGDPKLEALRSVILEEDRAAIARLQQKFDDPRQFAEAISSVLADAIALAGSRDEQLAKVAGANPGAGDPGVDQQKSRHHGWHPLPPHGTGDP